MNDKEQIELKIIDAMRISCSETFYFSEDETRLIDAEYLFTVNVAKEIVKLNSGIGYPLKIYLEHPTKKFATNCVPLMGRNPVTNRMTIRKKSRNTERNGKIDVAVYRDGVSFVKPVCAIELKGFNPQRKVILEDLKRNVEYFDFCCESGSSQISFTVFAAMHSCKNIRNKASVLSNENEVKTKYEGWLSELCQSINFKCDINVFTLDKNLAEDQVVPLGEELTDFDSHQFIGVVVTFTANQENK